MKKRRIIFYSHDTFGLGHIRRTQKIANQLTDKETSILIICSSPKASEYESEVGIEYLKLPGYTKLRTGNYIARNLNLEISEFIEFRSQLILSAVKTFKPDIFIVDKEPLGVGGELLPSLEYLKSNRPDCLNICGLRDILDEPEKLEQEWLRRKSALALEEYYQSILVYGDQKIYDLALEYKLSPALQRKMHYMGYLLQTSEAQVANNDLLELLKFENNTRQKPVVVFTLGGGEDGGEFLDYIADAVEIISEDTLNAIIVPGPFLPQEKYVSFLDRVSHKSNVKCLLFFPYMRSLISSAQLVVSMGGYNTFCENISSGKKPLILPRIQPRQEQLIRASIFDKLGLCSYIHPKDLNGPHLAKKIENLLRQNELSDFEFNTDGLENTKKYIKELQQGHFNA